MAPTIIATAERYKRSDEVLDYDFDFTEFLANGADTILTKSAAISPSGLTAGAISHSGGIVKQWLSSGTVGAVYEVLCTITTVSGRTKKLKLLLTII